MRHAYYLAILFGFACSAASKESERYWETPKQKFHALGGKETPAKIISRGEELTTADIAEGRDLSLYDRGGFYDCQHHWDKPSRDHCDVQVIRKFIWEHWHQKKRGYIRATFNSVDATSTFHIFVEPTSANRWHVAWRIARHTNEITDCADIISVAWESRKRGDKIGSKVLVFRHQDHSEIQRF